MLSEKQKQNIRFVTGDGARWIKDTVREHCPNAEFCIDPFHVVSWSTEALDRVRKDEWNKARSELAKERANRGKAKRGRPKGGSAEIKLSIRMAYGFRNIDNLISMIMLRCGGLAFSLPGRCLN